MDSTRIAGIVMECNPFHDGHQYILSRAREVSGASSVIVLMSGDYVQRGIPAVYAKELRAGKLLASGADLVLELPVRSAVSSAESFAMGAVSILMRTGIVTDLVFGSESGDLNRLIQGAALLKEEPLNYRNLLRAHLAAGLSFPAARERAAAECSAHISLSDTANDILGTEYIKALLPDLGLCPHAVPRIPAVSATEHRRALEASKDSSCLFADDLSELLLGRLLDAGRVSFKDRSSHPFAVYEGISDDLSDRIENLLPQYLSWTQFCRLLKTKNITYTAVSRALMHILLEIRKKEFPRETNYVRVLGCRRDAAHLLGRIQRESKGLRLITDLPKDLSLYPGLLQDIRASELYDYIARRKQNKGILPADFTADRISEYAKPFLLL
jgi:predicted nucleotidyltransferase